MAENGDEKYAEPAVLEAVAAKPKRKRMTAEEKLEKMKANIEAAAKKAANKKAATLKKRENEKAVRREKRDTQKKTLREGITNAVLRRASNVGLSISKNDVKIPGVGAKLNNAYIDKYFAAAKKRYYARTKKPSSIGREAERAAANEGIPLQYLKLTTRTKTMKDVLNAARKRYMKNTAKMNKSSKRAAMLRRLEEEFGVNEKDAMKIICVRKKAEAK
jgi:hypothetical protein